MAFDIDAALRYVVEREGSDLHVKVASPPIARIDAPGADAMLWVLGKTPVKATGMGAHARRRTGDQYDFFSVDYEYDNGVFCTAMCRQQNGTDKKVANEFTGTEGAAFILPTYYVTGPKAWKRRPRRSGR